MILSRRIEPVDANELLETLGISDLRVLRIEVDATAGRVRIQTYVDDVAGQRLLDGYGKPVTAWIDVPMT